MPQTGFSNSPYLSQKLNPHSHSQLIAKSYSFNIVIIYEFYPLLATDTYITLVQVSLISLAQYLLIILLSSLSKPINHPKTSLIKQSKYGLQGSLWFGFCSLLYSPDTIHTPRPLHHYYPAIVVFFLFLEWYTTLFYFRHLYFPVSARNILFTHHFSKYIFLVLQSMCGMFFYSHGTLPVCTFQFALHYYFMNYDPVHFPIAPSNHQHFSLHILLHEKTV